MLPFRVVVKHYLRPDLAAAHPHPNSFSITLIQPLSFVTFMHSSAQRTTLIHFSFNHLHTLYTATEGVGGTPSPNLTTFPRVLPYLIYFHRLLHFFALTKNTTPLFSIVSALCAKKHGVGGTPFPAFDRSEATIALRTSHRPAPTLSGSRITSLLFGHPHHCGERPLVQQSGKAQGIFTIRGNNSAPPGG